MPLPLGYSVRNVAVRRSSAILTALGIALTVAAFSGVGALRAGFRQLYSNSGRDQLAIYIREGSTSEGESGIPRDTAALLVKERPEAELNDKAQPLAAAECYLALFMTKVGGGRTNVPLRGIQPMSLELQGDGVRLLEGRWLQFGSDEVVVGRPLTERIENCRLGDTLILNTTPFRVVGVIEQDSAMGSEIWGDVERMMEALQRPVFQRVVARVKPGTDFARVNQQLEDDPRTASITAYSESDYLAKQTTALSSVLGGLAAFLTVIMGGAATLGAINTTLATVAARTHEIGILLALGFSRLSIFLAFVLESTVLGLLGGIAGIVLVLPFQGYQTGAMNWNTFTDVSFTFQVTPSLCFVATTLAVILGTLGGAVPALFAALKKPVEALRHQ
ncbi:MAG: ABC transporter permease [Planctomycetota bacterium]